MTDNRSPFSRRDFLKAGTVGAVGLHALGRNGLSRPEGNGKLRTALVGTGIRGSGTWGRTLLQRYGDVVDLVGLCDRNPKRMAFSKGFMGAGCPTYTDFDRMFEETKPELVIVTTTDCFHAKYICAAMEKGADVITEKPLATDEGLAQDIIDAEKRTGRKLTVAFNYRFGPDAVRIKEILKSGEIGEVTSVDFNYYLDIYHGASYFRRWHGFKQFSGSLLVHKATHHFDLMNWWLAAEPIEVNACGRLRKYGFNGPFRGERCRDCPHKSKCSFFWDITKDQHLMNLYVKPESEDGYLRDACVFREKINIWDTMNVQVKYHNDVAMSYSLNAFMPYEGFFVGFNGTEGRLDARIYHQTPWKTDALAEFRITRNFKGTKTFKIQSGGGGHWGADGIMQDRIFRGVKDDPLQQSAGTRDGVMSIMIGIAARRSIEQKRPFAIEELIKI